METRKGIITMMTISKIHRVRPPISDKLREKILIRDNYTCRYCGTKSGPFHIDHVYPHSKGGVTLEENLVTACVKCNMEKRDKIGIWPNPLHIFDNINRLVGTTIIMIGLITVTSDVFPLMPDMMKYNWIFSVVGSLIAWIGLWIVLKN